MDCYGRPAEATAMLKGTTFARILMEADLSGYRFKRAIKLKTHAGSTRVEIEFLNDSMIGNL